MRYFRKRTTKDIISLNDKKNQAEIDYQSYQNYLRENAIDTKDADGVDNE